MSVNDPGWVDVAGVVLKNRDLTPVRNTYAHSQRQWNQNMVSPSAHLISCEVKDVSLSSFVEYFVLRFQDRDLTISPESFRDWSQSRIVFDKTRNFSRLPPNVFRLRFEVLTGQEYPSDLSGSHFPVMCFVRLVCALHVAHFRDLITQLPRHPRTLAVFGILADFRFALLSPAEEPAHYVDSHFIHVDNAFMPAAPAWKLPLMPHQKQSLRWMQMVEQRMQEGMNFVIGLMYTPIAHTGYAMLVDKTIIVPHKPELLHDQRRKCTYHGAILADKTGSGKTAVALALLYTSEKRVACQEHVIQSGLAPVDIILSRLPVKATLLVVPLNLCKQWLREVDKFIEKRRLNILHVFSKHDYNALTVQSIQECDAILVSSAFLTGRSYGRDLRTPLYYDVLSIAERTQQGMLSGSEPVRFSDFLWRRIIYDEAHEQRDTLPEKITSELIAEMYWGLTGTPPLTCMVHRLNAVLHMSALNAEMWPIIYPDLIAATVRTTQASIQLPPPTVHEHLIDLSARERELMLTYALHGAEAVIQISTCFNVISLFTVDPNSAHVGGGASAAAEDHEFTLMTFTELARIMLQRHQAALQTEQKRVQHLEMQVEQDKQVMAILCARSGENMDALVAAGMARAPSTPSGAGGGASAQDDITLTSAASSVASASLGSSTALRSMVRQICHSKRLIEGSQGRMDVLQRQLAFCQAQLGQNERGACPICMDVHADVITPCAHWFCGACLSTHLSHQTARRTPTSCPLCKAPMQTEHVMKVQVVEQQDDVRMSSVPEVPLSDRCGSKLMQVIALLHDIKRRGERAIMFVQWTSLMRVIKATLSEAGVQAAQIYGNSNTRDLAIKKMQSGEVDVLLLSLETSSSGLNLVEANHVIFAHALLHDNVQVTRALTEQAVARVLRLGQTRPVHVHWFITRGTEETLFRT